MANMTSYVIKRILLTIPMIFALILLTWIMSQLMPGDPSSFFDKLTPQQIIDDFRLKWHLDDPWYSQLWAYLTNLLRGDLGSSITVKRGESVGVMLSELIPRTIEIVIIPIIIIPIIGIKTGVTTVKHRNKWQDNLVRGGTVLATALPTFFLGLLLQYLFGIIIPNFTGGYIKLPTSGLSSPGIGSPDSVTNFRLLDCIIANDLTLFMDSLKHLILPIICSTMISFAAITRQTRSSMLEILEQDYIRTARAKGCSESQVLNKHALRNALIPVSTVAIGLAFSLLAGSTIIEITFNINALGNMFVRAIKLNDYMLIVGIVQVVGIITIFGNLVIDVVYTLIDPRIMYD